MTQNHTELICINCPRGCGLQVTEHDGDIAVTGNFCNKGIPYAKQEITAPQRVLTVLMRPEGAKRPLSVKTDRPVPKAMLKECAQAVYSAHPKLPVKCGDVLIENLCGTGAKVVATADMEA